MREVKECRLRPRFRRIAELRGLRVAKFWQQPRYADDFFQQIKLIKPINGCAVTDNPCSGAVKFKMKKGRKNTVVLLFVRLICSICC
jgi:hypothetical protein